MTTLGGLGLSDSDWSAGCDGRWRALPLAPARAPRRSPPIIGLYSWASAASQPRLSRRIAASRTRPIRASSRSPVRSGCSSP